ncbi:6-carboxytetrahydropterin synthase [Nocardiopsis sp. NPDC006198]|uniref:6-carboxytetrahydropterin synthase n=1 Tax=Nocardiopsis sp. NPDC006198 TaxID=3154472 RepID=UPI0033A6A6DD
MGPGTIRVSAPHFCAAHAGLHGGRFEPLHGHTFTASLEVSGPLDAEGLVLDFVPLRRALAAATAELHLRTLMPTAPDTVVHRHEDNGTYVFDDGRRRIALPAQDVVVLPIVNTSTELIAQHLLAQLHPVLGGVEHAALTLAEAPTAAATAVYIPGQR